MTFIRESLHGTERVTLTRSGYTVTATSPCLHVYELYTGDDGSHHRRALEADEVAALLNALPDAAKGEPA